MTGGGVVEVAQQGFSWGSLLISGSSIGGFFALAGIIWKTRVPMAKLKMESDTSLREDLMEQMEKANVESTSRITRLEQRMEDQRAMYEARIEFERVSHQHELSTMRHRMSNLDQCLTMLLALIEENPDKAQAAAKRVREMRTKQEQAEAAEKAAIAAAMIAATAPVRPPAPPQP